MMSHHVYTFHQENIKKMTYKYLKSLESQICDITIDEKTVDFVRWTVLAKYLVTHVEEIKQYGEKTVILLELINPANEEYRKTMILSDDIVKIRKLPKKEDLLYRLEHNL
jgi:hypothetical protein